MARFRFLFGSALLSALLAVSCHSDDDDDDSGQTVDSSPTSSFDASIANAWFDLLQDLVKENSLSPPVASWAYGYAGVALYEAVVPGDETRQSLGGQLRELGELPEADSGAEYHWPAVANAALAGVVRGLLADIATAESLADVDALESGFSADVSESVLDRSADHGRAIAEAILAWAATDGYEEFKNCEYTPPIGDGLWVPTPPAFRPPLQPCWGQIRCFVLNASDICDPGPPTPYSTEPTSLCYAEANEVYTTVNNLTEEQTAIAQFWSDDPGMTSTPPGHWISIVKQVAEQYDLSLDVVAEAYARVGIAVREAFIACWQTKFAYNLLRPVTYIQATIPGGEAWLPILGTPPFPEYTSGHSIQSGAASEVLTDQFGDMSFVDDTHASRGFPSRSFASFKEAADEAAVSRLYGGIHYRLACTVGVNQGTCIAREIVSRIQFARD